MLSAAAVSLPAIAGTVAEQVPLRYRMVFLGSRSFICDDELHLNGAREFPLYWKGPGGDVRLYKTAMELLRRNIRQLLVAHAMEYNGKLNYAGNLYNFIERLLGYETEA